MRTYWLIRLMVLLMGIMPIMESAASQPKSLKAMLHEKKDKLRVLLLYSRDNTQPFLANQQKALNEGKSGLVERDVEVLVLIGSQITEPDRQFLIQKYKLDPVVDFLGWLIGKDGGIKQVYKKPVTVNELFRTIDSMPMRMLEMRNQ
ncbi:DUF4174 domain-containing protein [Spirosoma migulaei]